MNIPVSSTTRLNQAPLAPKTHAGFGLGKDIHGNPILHPTATVRNLQHNVGNPFLANKPPSSAFLPSGRNLGQLFQKNLNTAPTNLVGGNISPIPQVRSATGGLHKPASGVSNHSVVGHLTARSPTKPIRKSAIVGGNRISPIGGRRILPVPTNVPVPSTYVLDRVGQS